MEATSDLGHPVEGMAGRTITILVAEDNATNLFLMKEVLRCLRPAARVIACRNGHEAVRDVLASQPQLILMDVRMPDCDGIEAARAIRAHPAMAGIPIIACTAALAEELEACREAGMDDVLSKPISMAEVELLLARWLPLD